MNHIEEVVKQLSLLFTEDEQFPDCVYLYGQKSSGKTLSLQKFLGSRVSWLSSVLIDTNEAYTSKICYETVINGFNNHQLSPENEFTPFAKIDSIEEFLTELSSLDFNGTYIIAIENAEKLREMDINMFPVLSNLQNFTGLNISCIFTSHISFEKLNLPKMIKCYVPDYSKNDIAEILASKLEEVHKTVEKKIVKIDKLDAKEKEKRLKIVKDLDESFYKKFLDIFLSSSYKACRDFSELEFLSNKCYFAYLAPVLAGDVAPNDITNLWRSFSKVLKTTLSNSHMRIENLSATEMSQKLNEDVSLEPAKGNSIRAFAQTLELPYYAKYLLIASFLASHNESKFDKRLFMKHHGKQKKRQTQAKV